jgi:hypothetical protein
MVIRCAEARSASPFRGHTSFVRKAFAPSVPTVRLQTLNPEVQATVTQPSTRPWHQRGRKRCCITAAALASPPPLSLFALACKATFKLGMLCMAVAHLMRKGILPEALPQVLSKLVFNVTIPCMLVAKTAETLAYNRGDWRCLIVPVAIAIQARSLPCALAPNCYLPSPAEVVANMCAVGASQLFVFVFTKGHCVLCMPCLPWQKLSDRMASCRQYSDFQLRHHIQILNYFLSSHAT